MSVYKTLEVLQKCEALVPENNTMNATVVPDGLRAQVDGVLPELTLELVYGLARVVMHKPKTKKVSPEPAMTVFLYHGVVLAKEYIAVMPVIRGAVLACGAEQLAQYKAEQEAKAKEEAEEAEKAEKDSDDEKCACCCCDDAEDCEDPNGCGVQVLPDSAPQLLRDLLDADTVNDTDRRVFVCKAAAAGYTKALHVAHKKWCFSAEDIKAGVKSAADTGEMGAVAALMKFNKILWE
jgi:hypothetical protein